MDTNHGGSNLDADYPQQGVNVPRLTTSQIEDDLIWPVVGALGRTASLRQRNLSVSGREDVPDGLLFADDAAKSRANRFAQEWSRYELGLAVVGSKRWQHSLVDRRTGSVPIGAVTH